jgi:hypothetical protein
VTGVETAPFLQNIVTVDIDDVVRDGAGYGALLSPQGKVLFDFFIINNDGGFLIDAPLAEIGALAQRLQLYRLRAKVEIADATREVAVVAMWGGGMAPPEPGRTVPDPRLPALGWRAYVHRAAVGAALAAAGWHRTGATDHEAHRIALGVPAGGTDYAFGTVYPHEAAMDRLGGVDFQKGCYVGQEIVSRMEHRGTARSRPVRVGADRPLPPSGTGITAGGRPLGTLGSSADGIGIAIVRLDRAAEAMAARTAILAGDVPVRLTVPAWANYDWPETQGPEAPAPEPPGPEPGGG